jgi:hypothetical protein
VLLSDSDGIGLDDDDIVGPKSCSKKYMAEPELELSESNDSEKYARNDTAVVSDGERWELATSILPLRL